MNIFNIIKPQVRFTIALIGSLIFLFYAFGFVSMLTRRASTYAVNYAESSDAANSLGVLERTTWLKDNGFSAYGPLYYRIAHTLLTFDPIYKISAKSDVNARDKSSHIALMMVSLSAIVLMCLFLAWQTVPWWGRALAASLIMFAILASSELWTDFSVDNHPDALLSLFVALATWATVKSRASLEPDRQTSYRLLGGVLWGLALQTKMTAMTFLFGAVVILAMFSWRRLRTYIELVQFLAITALTYIIIGFPQSLKLSRLIRSMGYHVTKTVKNFDPVFWKNLFINVTWIPLLTIAAIIILFERQDKEQVSSEPLKPLMAGLIIPLFGFVSLFTLSYQNHMRHYILPVMSSFLVFAIPLFRRASSKVYFHLPRWSAILLRICGFCLCVFVIIKANGQYLPNTALRVYSRFQFQEEAEEFNKELMKYIGKKIPMVGDPFIPIDARRYTIPAPRDGFTKEFLGSALDAEVFVASKWFYERFLPDKPGEWVLLNMTEDEYKKKHEFYQRVSKGDNFIDSAGRAWGLKFRTSIGWDIWERIQKSGDPD